jgi:hypothetical protein
MSIAFLAIDEEGLRERLVHRVPRHFIQGISQIKKMVTIPKPFTTVSCFAWCRERQKHTH